MALDPAVFRADGEFENDLDDVIDVLHASAPSDAAQPVLVAGEPEAMSRRARLRTGIPIPDALAEKIRNLFVNHVAPFLAEAGGPSQS